MLWLTFCPITMQVFFIWCAVCDIVAKAIVKYHNTPPFFFSLPPFFIIPSIIYFPF